MKQEYDKNYFEKKAKDLGLILRERRPLWRRWLKIIQKYKASGKLLDVGCGLSSFLAYVKEFCGVLKNGGIFVIRVPNTSSLGARWKKEKWFGHRDKTHVSLLSNEGWLSLLKERGFEIMEVFYDWLWDTPFFRATHCTTLLH